MPLICFFGSDGSGKTALAMALTRELKRKNFKLTIAWMRGTHTLASLKSLLLPCFLFLEKIFEIQLGTLVAAFAILIVYFLEDCLNLLRALICFAKL
jgi:thymidylate kinase